MLPTFLAGGTTLDQLHQFFVGLSQLRATIALYSAHMNIALGLSLALVGGFIGGRLVKLIKLPSITGYILVGLLMGPNGLGFITESMATEKLRLFADIALMLIAFGIGERLNITTLKRAGRSVLLIPLTEGLVTFGSVFFVTWFLGATVAQKVVASQGPASPLVAACLLGAIAMATAPATTLAMVKELGAVGPVARTLMACVAIDNALAIGAFALFTQVFAKGQAAAGMIQVPGGAIGVIAGSLLWGALVAWITHFALAFITREGDVQVVTFGALLLLGSLAEAVGLSGMLAGMTAGFVIVNHNRQDTRSFVEINKLESPIYVVFFVLAGAHLSIQTLWTSGALGLAFIVMRGLGKFYGARLGAVISSAEESVKRFLGGALLPQAGVAVGLVFALEQNPAFSAYAGWLTDIVLTGVALAELIGPPLVKRSLEQCAVFCSMKGAPPMCEMPSKEKS